MGFIGDLAKAVLMTWVFFWVLAMVYFFATEQLALGTLFLVGLLIPSSFMVYGYWKYRKKNNRTLTQDEGVLVKENKVKARRFGRREIALVALLIIIFTSIEVYAHTYVQIHSLPVVSEEEVQIQFSNSQYYTGNSAFSSSGCRWVFGWLVRRPAPQYGYVSIFKTDENRSYFVLSTDFVVLGLEAASNNTSNFSAHSDEIIYESNFTAIRIDYELGEAGTYLINFQLHLRVYERTLIGLVPKEDVTIPINATVYYGP